MQALVARKGPLEDRVRVGEGVAAVIVDVEELGLGESRRGRGLKSFDFARSHLRWANNL